ncbi:hypothetical protein [Flagellimonas sp.]|uniref:hypothetical protein n=1 Tax=Flagellimonas sp. TaxID=2058762 RepID=UPI003BB1769C
MEQRGFESKTEAIEYLKHSCPDSYSTIFDDEDALALFEILHEAYYDKRVFSSTDLNKNGKQNIVGHSAYIPKLKIYVNIEKAALVVVAAVVDLIYTYGLANIVLNQIMANPMFINRLSDKQHLICLLKYKYRRELNLEKFRKDLNEGKCNHIDFQCEFETSGFCHITEIGFADAKENLISMEMIID